MWGDDIGIVQLEVELEVEPGVKSEVNSKSRWGGPLSLLFIGSYCDVSNLGSRFSKVLGVTIGMSVFGNRRVTSSLIVLAKY